MMGATRWLTKTREQVRHNVQRSLASIFVAAVLLMGFASPSSAQFAAQDLRAGGLPGLLAIQSDEMTWDEMRALQSMRALNSECLSGTDYCLQYVLGSYRAAFRIGDRLRFTCKPLATDSSQMVCDSVVISAELGKDQLPIGIEWVLLSPADLGFSIESSRRLLDSRFPDCGNDSTGYRPFHLVVTAWDSTGRARSGNRELQHAWTCLQQAESDSEFAAVLPILRKELSRRPDSVLRRVLYARALAFSDHCDEYYEQCVLLSRRGFSSRLLSRDQVLKYCRGWNGHRDE